jgi:aminoglycoside phosphotransferase family enzyme/predicted kinase
MNADPVTHRPEQEPEERENSTGVMVRSLLNPAAYPPGTSSVAHAETHISHVFLTDDHAYKLKKPVRFPFLDYSTLSLRLGACQDEVRLNRRLASTTYLGVLPITRNAAGDFRVGGSDGSIVDYCVEMNRLPADRMLDHMIRAGTATPEQIERLLDVLIPFYARSERGAEINRHVSVPAIEANVRQNLAAIDESSHGPDRAMYLRVRSSQLQFLKLQSNTLDERVRLGRACEGHGDLRPEHICFVRERPVVFDCVEFSLPLRASDVISELSFLAMECDFLGAPALGRLLIEGYKQRSSDGAPESLVAFYKAYRACVRAKVELLRAGQETGGAAARARKRAHRYVQLASSYALDFYRPKLIVMIGAAGTGKSTVADALASAMGLEVLRSDEIRHELAGRREPNAAVGQGIYSDSMNRVTYDELVHRATAMLREGASVVMDGTFRDPEQRTEAYRLGHDLGAETHFIYCRCPADVARTRISRRIEQQRTRSDARPELHEVQQRELDEARDLQSLPVISLETTEPVATLTEQVIAAISRTSY